MTLGLSCAGNLQLLADPERMSQAIVNLLSNALRATEKGGRVSIDVAPLAEELKIVIEDSGSGIGQEHLPLIFERFYHGPRGGMGIGLTIVKELVKAQGGRIEVKSALGQGSSFSLFFPEKGVHNSS